jgi:hypothetical protein
VKEGCLGSSEPKFEAIWTVRKKDMVLRRSGGRKMTQKAQNRDFIHNKVIDFDSMTAATYCVV